MVQRGFTLAVQVVPRLPQLVLSRSACITFLRVHGNLHTIHVHCTGTWLKHGGLYYTHPARFFEEPVGGQRQAEGAPARSGAARVDTWSVPRWLTGHMLLKPCVLKSLPSFNF